MACLYKRGKNFWIAYYLNGKQVYKSLRTANERVAETKKRKIEYELAIGELRPASRLPLPDILERFCRHIRSKQTRKSYRNDFSQLRVFFGPICKSLEIPPVLIGVGHKSRKPRADKYANRHMTAKFLEDITPELINRFISTRVEQDDWSPKTANNMRQTLHLLFAYAAKHHGFQARDYRCPNPAGAVDRRTEPAPEIQFLSLEGIQEQLGVLKDHPTTRVAVGILIYAGLRREEVLGSRIKTSISRSV